MRSPPMIAAAMLIAATSSCSLSEIGTTDCKDYGASPIADLMELRGRMVRVTQPDRDFICRATVENLAEASFGRMAEERSADPAVKAFARRMIEDHASLDRQLQLLADQLQDVVPPGGLDAAHIGIRDALAPLEGEAFDRAYVASEVEDHRSAIAFYEREARNGGAAVLADFAARTLPLLRRHLEAAQGIEARPAAGPPELLRR